MPPKDLRLAAAVALAIVLAGCGSSSAPYTADSTAPCLRKLGYSVEPPTSDLIADTAENGGLIARGFGNTLTLAFGADARDGLRLARAYRRFGPKRLRDLIQPKRNAVMVWTIAPTLAQMEAARKCLK